jgi:hypothetical protein
LNATGQIGGLLGSALFATLVGSGVPVGTAAMYLVFFPMLIGTALIFGARNVAPRTELEAIAM